MNTTEGEEKDLVNQSQTLPTQPSETLRAATEAVDGQSGQLPQHEFVPEPYMLPVCDVHDCGLPPGAHHSPLPWRISDTRAGWRAIADANGDEIVDLCGSDGADEPKLFPEEANAELIVKAVNSYSTLVAAAKAALKYVDNLNEDTPVDPNCKECVGRVFFTKGTPEPPLCWIHQLEQAVKEMK